MPQSVQIVNHSHQHIFASHFQTFPDISKLGIPRQTLVHSSTPREFHTPSTTSKLTLFAQYTLSRLVHAQKNSKYPQTFSLHSSPTSHIRWPLYSDPFHLIRQYTLARTYTSCFHCHSLWSNPPKNRPFYHVTPLNILIISAIFHPFPPSLTLQLPHTPWNTCACVGSLSTRLPTLLHFSNSSPFLTYIPYIYLLVLFQILSNHTHTFIILENYRKSKNQPQIPLSIL